MGAGPFSGDPFLVSGNVQEAARVPEGRMPPLDDSDSEEEHDLDQEEEEEELADWISQRVKVPRKS